MALQACAHYNTVPEIWCTSDHQRSRDYDGKDLDDFATYQCMNDHSMPPICHVEPTQVHVKPSEEPFRFVLERFTLWSGSFSLCLSGEGLIHGYGSSYGYAVWQTETEVSDAIL